MPDKTFLMEQAARCRRLAAGQTDERIKAELLKLAAELEETARGIKKDGSDPR